MKARTGTGVDMGPVWQTFETLTELKVPHWRVWRKPNYLEIVCTVS